MVGKRDGITVELYGIAARVTIPLWIPFAVPIAAILARRASEGAGVVAAGRAFSLASASG